ncbi:alpha/beta hydrolase [Evansella sp. LMS18]|uniref:alpha/beta fold hydrolase n=1 Tax=Evansella sp. LMS18 TaxID=2924033 RepID=UPI0020D08BEE|nr:alpha/beta hydrolase [Evansella sp. LMS18]UTR12580.1 alpha/beta hydrolase [Evansella sp. LMS18]
MAYVKVNGVKLFVRIYGAGEPVVVLHGLHSSHASMLPVVNGLKKKYKVIAYDCRGHGRSEKPGSYRLKDHSEDLKSILGHYGLGKVNVIGFSMGSYIVQQTAILSPDLFNKIILIAPKSHGAGSSVEEFLKGHGLSLSELSEIKLGRILSRQLFSPGTSFLKKIKPMLLKRFSPGLTSAQRMAASNALKGFDLTEDLKELPVPTLVLSGKDDKINPPELGQETAALIPGGEFLLFEKSGHMIHFEEEKKCIQAINEFLV